MPLGWIFMLYFVFFMFRKCRFSGSIINCVLKHKKLPLLHCYHIFSKTKGVYLAKNHYEHYSPQMVPTDPTGSRTIRHVRRKSLRIILLTDPSETPARREIRRWLMCVFGAFSSLRSCTLAITSGGTRTVRGRPLPERRSTLSVASIFLRRVFNPPKVQFLFGNIF